MVNLGDHAVHAVPKLGGDRHIGAGATTLIADARQEIWIWPWVARQKSQAYCIQGFTSICNVSLGGRNHGRVGHTARACLRSRFALSFVVYEEERLVLGDGTAERTTKLIVVEWILPALGVEEVAGATDGTGAVVFQ